MLKPAWALVLFFSQNVLSATGASLVMWGKQQIVDQPIKAFHASEWHALAVKDNGQVIAWGYWNSGGRWAYYPVDAAWPTSVPQDLGKAVAVAAGDEHSLALLEDGSVRAWGANSKGQLNLPKGIKGVKAIAAHEKTSFLVTGEGQLLVMGDTSGSLGHVPADLPPIKQFVISDTGWMATLGVNGEVTGWGAAYQSSKWKEKGTWKDIVSLASATVALVGLRSNGELAIRGDSGSFLFESPDSVGQYRSVACASDFCVAETDSGTVIWGTENYKQASLRTAVKYTHLMPCYPYVFARGPNQEYVSIRGVSEDRIETLAYDEQAITQPIRSVVNNQGDILILNESGTVKALRYNRSSSKVPDFRALTAGAPIRSMAALGKYYFLGMEKGSVILTQEAESQFGSSPVPQDNIPVVDIKTDGVRYCLALKENGKVYAWSQNGKIAQTEVPEAAQGAKAIAAIPKLALALKPDGKVIVWGDTTGYPMRPEQLEGIQSIAAGEGKVAAVKKDGTVLIWGEGATSYLKPPPDLGTVKSVAIGLRWVAALLQTGKVVVWGGYDTQYDYGQADVPNDLDGVESIVASGMSIIAVRRASGSSIVEARSMGRFIQSPRRTSAASRNALGRVEAVVGRGPHVKMRWDCEQRLSPCQSP